MSELRLILGLARREARERARSRAFLFSTAILALAAVGAVALPMFFAERGEAYAVGVVGTVPGGLEELAGQRAPDDVTIAFVPFDDRVAAEAALTAEEASIDVLLTDEPGLVWSARPDARLAAILTDAVSRWAIAERAADLGVPPHELGTLLAPVSLSSSSLDDEAASNVETRGPRILIATAGMILLFASIVFYGSYILMSVIEEKQNRVIEVLLAHVDPRHLLAGKVLGHGVLGLAQILVVAAVAAVGLWLIDPVDVSLAGAYGSIAGVVLWFLLGFAFYSVLYGALGSLASRAEDAQSAVGPLTVVLMGVYVATFAIIDNPDGPLAVVGSFLPPTAPLMMPIRTALTVVPVWQVVLAVALEVAAIVGVTWLGGRLYRGAVLRVGRKLSIREAWQATR